MTQRLRQPGTYDTQYSEGDQVQRLTSRVVGPPGGPGVQGVQGVQGIQGIQGFTGPVGTGTSGLSFETRTALSLYTVPVDIKYAYTAGFAAVGDRGHGVYTRRNTAPPDVTNPGFVRSVDRWTASGTSDSTNGGWWELVAQGAFYVEQFGGKGDYYLTDEVTAISFTNPTPTDNHAAILYASHYLVSGKSQGVNIAGGTKVIFGYGGYYSSDKLVPLRTVCWEGMGAGNYHDVAQSWVVFPAGSAGVETNSYGEGVPNAGHTLLRGLYFHCLGTGGQTTKHGLTMDVQTVVEYCGFANFGGDGINIAADAGVGQLANCFFLNYIWVDNCAGDGYKCSGGDANAGTGIGLTALFCGGYGINDSSFLGNTWVGCHTNGNTTGAYWGGGSNSRSAWVGCYSESNQPPSNFTPAANVFGGFHAAGINGDAVRVTETVITGHLGSYTGPTAGNEITTAHNFKPNTIFSATIDPLGTGIQPHSSFVYYPPTGTFGWAIGDPGFISGNFAFEITSEKGLQTYGRAEALPALKFGVPTGVFLGGDDVFPRKFWYNDKWIKQFTLGAGHVMAPGAYLRGDIMLVYQDADTGNDYMGEFCTQDGVVTPNVWTTGTSYGAGANSYVKNSAGKFYRVLNSPGVASTVEPTHASGTVTTGDTYQWKWLANQPGVFKRFGNLLGAKSTTVNDPITNLFQTWNAAGVTFQGHKTNITDTASAAASVIQEWQVGGTRKVAIGKQGGLGVFGAAPPTAQPTVTGSRGGNAALASLLTALAATGIIVDGTSA